MSEPPYFIIELNSSGGDVAIAAEIGRLLREIHANVRVSEGAEFISACVFILMGGERRWIRGKVGIHGPFFEVPAGTVSTDEIKQDIDLTTEYLREYARELNVSPRLIDEMLVIPPVSVRFLSEAELEAYGLVEVDPVAAEARSLEEAKAWGLNRVEYMARKAKVRTLCGWPRDSARYRDVMAGRR